MGCIANRVAGLLCLLAATLARAQEAAPLPGPNEAGAGKLLWKYAPPGREFDSVVVHGDSLFVLDRMGAIHAVDAATGRKLWVTEASGFDRYFGLTVAARSGFEAIVVGCDDGLFALGVRDGKQLWRTAIQDGVAGPTCATDVVVAGGADGKVYGCDLRTGRILWQHGYLADRPDDPPGFRGSDARFEQPARPRGAVSDGNLVVLSILDQCRMLALDAATGKRLWDFRTGGWLFGVPLIGPLYVYLGSQDEKLYAVDRELGKLAWEVRTKGRNSAVATLAKRFVYHGSSDGNLYAIDAHVGRVAWKFAIDRSEQHDKAINSRPLVLGDLVCVGAFEGTIYAVHAGTGKLQWKLRPVADSVLYGNLATDGQRLFTCTGTSSETKGESALVAIGLQ